GRPGHDAGHGAHPPGDARGGPGHVPRSRRAPAHRRVGAVARHLACKPQFAQRALEWRCSAGDRRRHSKGKRAVDAPRPSARHRGVACVLVLWVIATLSILLGSFAMITRTENLQARHLFDTTRARYAAEAGLNLAVYELRKND